MTRAKLDWLETANFEGFKYQNGQVCLFGPGPEQWTADNVRAFGKAPRELWESGGLRLDLVIQNSQPPHNGTRDHPLSTPN